LPNNVVADGATGSGGHHRGQRRHPQRDPRGGGAVVRPGWASAVGGCGEWPANRRCLRMACIACSEQPCPSMRAGRISRHRGTLSHEKNRFTYCGASVGRYPPNAAPLAPCPAERRAAGSLFPAVVLATAASPLRQARVAPSKGQVSAKGDTPR